MSPSLRLVLAGVGTSLLLLGLVALFISRPAGDGLVPNVDIPFYSMPWNDNPFYPAEITTGDGKLANWETVPSAEFCGQCHRQEFREWVSSIHAVSGPDLIYELTADLNVDAHKSRQGVEKGRWCESCHEPLPVLMGEVNPIPATGPSAAAKEGTTCIVCHTAVAAEPLAGNGGLTLEINNLNQYLDPGLIMAAPAEHARAMQAKSHNPLMGQSDLCGACHTEIRPTVINGQEPMHLQETYDEWRRSGYAKMDVHCQDCHMNPNPAAYVAELKETGLKPVGQEVSHRFVGINYLLADPDLPGNLMTFLRGGYPPGDLSPEAWQAELRVQRELILGLMQEAADLAIAAPEAAPLGQELPLELLVTNSGAGHNLPTGPLDQRLMWLELKVTDSAGRQVYHSGGFNPNTGQVDPDSVMYLKLLWDKNGRRITRHILFDVDRLEYTRSPIPPQATDTVAYTVPIPETARGPLKVEAKLWYKLALQEMIEFNVNLKLVVPPVLLAETSLEIPTRR